MQRGQRTLIRGSRVHPLVEHGGKALRFGVFADAYRERLVEGELACACPDVGPPAVEVQAKIFRDNARRLLGLNQPT